MSGQGTPPGGLPPGPGVPTDQSMEDILASIRRILSEDEAQAPAAATPAGPPVSASETAPAASDAEPLLLTEAMMVSAPEDLPPAQPEVTPVPVAVPTSPAPPESLLAPAVAAAAAASVGQLLRAVSSDRGSAVSRGGPTIEDVVREELRPLLKDWLDQHLPAIVERLVRAEIERVVGRALS